MEWITKYSKFYAQKFVYLGLCTFAFFQLAIKCYTGLQIRVCKKIIFLNSQEKHLLWVLKRTVSLGWFFWEPKTHVLTDWEENRYNYTLKNLAYLGIAINTLWHELADFYCLFVLLLYLPVNSYGHGGTVSSPNHTFSWASLNKQFTSTSCTYFCL